MALVAAAVLAVATLGALFAVGGASGLGLGAGDTHALVPVTGRVDAAAELGDMVVAPSPQARPATMRGVRPVRDAAERAETHHEPSRHVALVPRGERQVTSEPLAVGEAGTTVGAAPTPTPTAYDPAPPVVPSRPPVALPGTEPVVEPVDAVRETVQSTVTSALGTVDQTVRDVQEDVGATVGGVAGVLAGPR